jgi:hypothetical protein
VSEVIELACACCELLFGVAEWAATRGKKANDAVPSEGAPARSAREQRRGVRIAFAKRHIRDIEFLAGPAKGKRASELPDMELKRLALALPHRVARFAVRRYLRNRKYGRVPPAPDTVVKR